MGKYNHIRTRYFLAACAVLPFIGACSRARLPDVPAIPLVHRIDVQQGNVITQEMVAQLKPGMDKKKVNFIMGSPLIMDTFHADRWDYVYSLQEGFHRAEKRRVTLFFKDDKLVRVTGDVKAAAGPLVVDTRQDESVEVPGEYKPGLVSRLTESLPFVKREGEPDDNDDEDAKLRAKSAAPASKDDAGPDTPSADDEQASSGDTDTPVVTIPDDAPLPKKKSFFARIFGRDDDSDDAAGNAH